MRRLLLRSITAIVTTLILGASVGVLLEAQPPSPNLTGGAVRFTQLVGTATALLRTGTVAGNTLLMQAYDTDAPGYTTLLTLTAGNTVSMTGLFGGSLANPGVSSSNDPDTGFWNFSGSGKTAYVANTNVVFSLEPTTLQMSSAASLGWNAAANFNIAPDLILIRENTATLQLGADVNGAAVAQTIKAHDGITGTDISGANLIHAAGRGTGAGAPGTLIFQTATALGSGTTAQTLATRLIIGATGAATFGTTAGTGTGAVYADTYYTGTTVGCSGTPTVATKGIATTCTEPVPEPLTQSEVTELRGLLASRPKQ